MRTKDTVAKTIDYRKNYYKKYDRAFHNADYENYWLMSFSLKGKQRENLQFDFEYLYTDCDEQHRITPVIENKCGFVYLRNTKEEFTDTEFQRFVQKMQADEEKHQRMLQRYVKFIETTPIPANLVYDAQRDV